MHRQARRPDPAVPWIAATSQARLRTHDTQHAPAGVCATRPTTLVWRLRCYLPAQRRPRSAACGLHSAPRRQQRCVVDVGCGSHHAPTLAATHVAASAAGVQALTQLWTGVGHQCLVATAAGWPRCCRRWSLPRACCCDVVSCTRAAVLGRWQGEGGRGREGSLGVSTHRGHRQASNRVPDCALWLGVAVYCRMADADDRRTRRRHPCPGLVGLRSLPMLGLLPSLSLLLALAPESLPSSASCASALALLSGCTAFAAPSAMARNRSPIVRLRRLLAVP